MALKTLKDVERIDGFDVAICRQDFDAKKRHVLAGYPGNGNVLMFRIQDGPIKEAGANGCQVDTVIEAAVRMVSGLNNRFPCVENGEAIAHLSCALDCLRERKKNREQRGVEGTSKA